MEKRILVPIDQTDTDREVISFADKWGQQTGAELYFLHTSPLPPYTNYPSENQDDQLSSEQVKVRKESLVQFRRIIETRAVQSKYQIIHRFGVPYWEIIEVEKKVVPDCILMGCHSYNSFQRLFLGSNTDYIVHHSKSPVYIYKKTNITSSDHTILIPVDFTKINKSVSLLADEWASRTKADLCFLHVAPTEEFDRSVLEDYVSSLNLSSSYKTILKFGKPYQQILEYQNEVKASLIMMADHSHTLLNRWFTGSNTNYLLHHTQFPIYIYKEN